MRIDFIIYIIIFCLALILVQPAFSDYILMCTFFTNPVAKIFKLSDEGDISFLYSLEVGGNPESLVFSPNGHWGLIGSNTTSYPPTQKTIILGATQEREIYYLGYAHCENQNFVTISPNSKYGLFGWNLQTIIFNLKDNSFNVIPTNNPPLSLCASFSSLNNRILAIKYNKTVEEFVMLDDKTTTSTGFTVDISPSKGRWIYITPDGKTGIVLNPDKYQITTLRMHPEGGFHIVQQFDTKSGNPDQLEITDDGKFAIIVYYSNDVGKGMKSFSIGDDSCLTEVDGIDTPEGAGEDMAVTPDGKFAVTRTLNANGTSTFNVVRIYPDGKLQYLPEKDFTTTGHVSAMDFLPPYQPYPENSFVLY